MSTPPPVPHARFDTTLSAFGNNTGIVVPESVVQQLGAGKKPPVEVDMNGHTFRSTVAVMGGEYLIGVSAAIRKETGLRAGDAIHVRLTLADAPRDIGMPADFAAALDAQPDARRFFDGLSNSMQRYHTDLVNGAKSADTRQRRIDKAVALFLDGKQR